MTGVDVVAGRATCCAASTGPWSPTSAGWCSAPTARARRRCCSWPAARLHPTRGEVRRARGGLGRVDVFELRPRIGLSSAALAERIPPDETVRDVVVTAGYAVVGRWRERYDSTT